jgi:HEAT repeat protein
VEVLMELLGDEDAGVRASAAEALGKLGHWPAAPSVARLLRDPAWRVRREAGLALRALGSPGQLLLRRSLADEDRFAAEMSRQILDLPEATVERGVR